MSVKYVNVPEGLIEQPGWIMRKSKDGLVTLQTTFECREARLVNLMPRIGTAHPQFSFLKLDEITGARVEGGMANMDCLYKGAEPGTQSERTPPVYQLVASTREEPLGSHPRYKDVNWSQIKAWQAGETTHGDRYGAFEFQTDGSGNWTALTGRELEYAKKIVKGVDSYLARGVVWRETATGSGVGSVADVGKISAPVGGAPSNGDGNWLLLSAEQTTEGGTTRRVREWMAGDWDTNIYG